MTAQELYDHYLFDEEYDLLVSPKELYSYRSGWNEALKRAAIVLRNKIRPETTTYIKQPSGWEYCSHCNKVLEPQDKFCWNCGAELVRDVESEKEQTND